MLNRLITNKKIILCYLIVSVLPFLISISDIYFGRIAFWYDPARDLLLALQNLKNPTFIGQPSGLPGLFYGPYWIWIISFLTLISKDPRIIAFLLLTVPYFTIFPFILYKISKSWGLFIFISIWLLFILNFGGYPKQIWNVHYGAIFLIIAIYLFINPENRKYFKSLNFLFLGASVGLITNFHLSFGIPTTVAFIFSIIFMHIVERRKNFIKSLNLLLKKLFLLITGIGFSFLPFLIFEIRHSFIQTKTFVKAITDSIVYNTASVGQTGMTDQDILNSFFGKFTDLLGVPLQNINLIFGFIFITSLVIPLIKKTKLEIFEKRLLILIFFISAFLLTSFMFNENPTWAYYFIGVEILFLLFIGLFLSKINMGRYIIFIPLVLAVISRNDDLQNVFEKNNFSNSDLGTRTNIAEIVFNDAENDFNYVAYSSAIYTYEFDYLFKWLDEKNLKNIDSNSNITYVIIPNVEREIAEDFINYKTPSDRYELVGKWKFPDGTNVYKLLKK